MFLLETLDCMENRGAFSTVSPNTAAIIPYQFSESRKRDLRPFVGEISGVAKTVNGKTSHFTSITDVVDGASPLKGIPVRDALMELFPDQLILEITGGQDLGDNADVTIVNYPNSMSCPDGTKEVSE